MECSISLDSKNYGVGASQNMEIAGVKTMKSSKVGGAQRKRLSDISNLKEQPVLQKRDTTQQSSLLKTYEYVDKLQKENMALTKVLAERNHIIEISRNELETLRTNFQKLQQQNLQFAQANSQMFAELNSGKERLKALQHELGCKNGILMSRKSDLERKGKAVTFQPGGVGTAECSEAVESMNTNEGNRPCKTNRRRQSRKESFGTSVLQTEVHKVESKRPRRQSARFKTEEPVAANHILETDNSNSNDALQCKETSVRRAEVQKVEGKRPCSRRQSARLKNEEPVATNDLLGIENFNSTDASQCRETSVLQTEVQKGEGIRPCLRRQSARFKLEEPVAIKDSLDTVNSNSTSASLCNEIVCEVKIVPTSSVETEDNGNSTDRSEVQERRRTSVGRPLRRAAEKIQSYKEIPLNVKMRRPV
ncbi:SHUGOSHIN 2-like isoform X3 [Cucurbita moschata]|uniref:SHUGOSHIN 2-like isoform X3 n=1 Tax=Cucurbita moschata TaxID=3662 RepID=A0A6J1FG21_CUCMO|nr:SHUGOSHIN 2-like isoform X3 [Cucurbita moschata]